MKTFRLLYVLGIVAAGVALASCARDKGNYDYRQINEVTIAGLPTGEQFILRSQAVNVIPDLESSLAGDESDYTYEWTYVKENRVIGSSFPMTGVFATTRNLENFHYPLPADTYTIYYTVTDHGTGIKWQAYYTITVQTEIYEGFLVMNDIEGVMRLDMLSYTPNSTVGQLGTFQQITDVLAFQGSALPQQSGPIAISVFTDANAPSEGYSIFLLTNTSTSQIASATFEYQPSYDLSSRFLSNVPYGIRARSILPGSSSAGLLIDWDYKAYIYARANNALWSSPLNSIDGGVTFFKASPFTAGSSTEGYVIFNEDNKKFYRMDRATGALTVTPHAETNVVFTDMTLIAAKQIYSSPKYRLTYLLRNETTKACKLLRFTYDGELSYSQDLLEASVPGIGTATHIATSTEFPTYVFYCSGGKLYQYDTADRISRLMIDFGADKTVTYIDIPTNIMSAKYAFARDRLIVCTRDNTTGAGAMTLYNVPAANGTLTATSMSWTGFGKIVSVAYRPR